MRVVIDTNVLVSGLLTAGGPPGRVVDLLLAGEILPLFDDRILAEYDEVLHRSSFAFPRLMIDPILDLVCVFGTRVVPRPLALVLSDEADLPFLEVAVAGQADCIVTGNRKHFVPVKGSGSHDMRVLAPREFLELLRG